MGRALSDTDRAWVYVIGSHDAHADRLKVGFSLWPEHRCDQLTDQMRERLFVRWAAEVPRACVCAVERMAHLTLAPWRRDGEWFAVDLAAAMGAINKAVSDYDAGLRPARPQAPRLTATLPRPVLNRIEEWRATQRPIPSRADAVRHLIEWALDDPSPPSSPR